MSFQIKRNMSNLCSIYKIYYIRKIISKFQSSKISIQEKKSQTFLCYGTINQLSHLKRLEFLAQFNKMPNVKMNFSFVPYSNFKRLRQLSNMFKFKNRLKGGLFYQIEIEIYNENSSSVSFYNQLQALNTIEKLFNMTCSDTSKNTQAIRFFPSIIIIKTNKMPNKPIRYSFFCKKIKNFDFFNYDKIIVDIITLLLYNQTTKTIIIKNLVR